MLCLLHHFKYKVKDFTSFITPIPLWSFLPFSAPLVFKALIHQWKTTNNCNSTNTDQSKQVNWTKTLADAKLSLQGYCKSSIHFLERLGEEKLFQDAQEWYSQYLDGKLKAEEHNANLQSAVRREKTHLTDMSLTLNSDKVPQDSALPWTPTLKGTMRALCPLRANRDGQAGTA